MSIVISEFSYVDSRSDKIKRFGMSHSVWLLHWNEMQAWELALCRAAAAQAGNSHLPGFMALGTSSGEQSESTSDFNTKAAG